MKLIIHGIDAFNPIENHIDTIIECLVEEFGEKYRTKIKSNIKNTTFIFLPQTGSMPISDQLDDYPDVKFPKEILTIDDNLELIESDYIDNCNNHIINYMAKIKNISVEELLEDENIYNYADDYFSLIDYDLKNLYDNMLLS